MLSIWCYIFDGRASFLFNFPGISPSLLETAPHHSRPLFTLQFRQCLQSLLRANCHPTVKFLGPAPTALLVDQSLTRAIPPTAYERVPVYILQPCSRRALVQPKIGFLHLRKWISMIWPPRRLVVVMQNHEAKEHTT